MPRNDNRQTMGPVVGRRLQKVPLKRPVRTERLRLHPGEATRLSPKYREQQTWIEQRVVWMAQAAAWKWPLSAAQRLRIVEEHLQEFRKRSPERQKTIPLARML